MEEQSVLKQSDLVLTKESQGFLKEIAKWSYFLSILGFVGVVLFIVLALFMRTMITKLSAMSGGVSAFGSTGGNMLTFVYLLFSAVYYFPVYYLFQFSTKMKLALKNNDSDKLNESFQFLKSHYKFIGVLALGFVVIYGVIFLFSILMGAFSFFN